MIENMTKKDLRERMVVETREGNRYLVCGNSMIRDKGYCNFYDYDDNLLTNFSSLDIVKVYEEIGQLEDITDSNLNLLWERKEYHEPKLGDVYVDTDGDKTVIYDIGKYPNGDTKYYVLIAIHDDIEDESKLTVMDMHYGIDEIEHFQFIRNNTWYVDSIDLIKGCLNDEQIQN